MKRKVIKIKARIKDKPKKENTVDKEQLYKYALEWAEFKYSEEIRREEKEVSLIDDYSVLLNSDKFAAQNSDESSDNSRLNTIKEKFAVLQEDPVSKDWEVLNNQTKPDDFSILDKLGDGLLAAAKFATGMYLGKLF